MKVLLRSDVQGVGRRGDIVDVKSGYARNFLLPSGAALIANDTMETQASSMRKARDVRDSLIEQAKIQIAARAGTNGRLFGSVSESDVVNAIRTATNISLDRHMISMTEHLKELGSATVDATLFDGVVAKVNIEIVAK